jgi:methyltransferase
VELTGTRAAFVALVGLVAVQRLLELRLSNRHVRQALARGGIEYGAPTYRYMVALHAAALTAAPIEVLWRHRPWIPPLGLTVLALLAGMQALRYWAIRTLGDRWMTRVICVPGDRMISGGPYRFMRHPNYLAVCAELAALPLVHTAWVTALVASVANAAILRQRIAIEEAALSRYCRPQEAPRP